MATATVAATPPPLRRLLNVPASAISAGAPILRNPINRRKAIAVTFEQSRTVGPTTAPKPRRTPDHRLRLARHRPDRPRLHPARRLTSLQRKARHAHHHHGRCGRDLLQGLGIRPAPRLPSRLAAVGRRLGQPDAVLPRARLSGHRPRPAGHGRSPDQRRPRHGHLCGRPCGPDRASRPARCGPHRALHRWRRSRALHRPARSGPSREGRLDQRGPAAHGADRRQPRRPADEVFDDFAAQLAANRSEFYRALPSGPFYGFNRPGVELSEASSGTGGARA